MLTRIHFCMFYPAFTEGNPVETASLSLSKFYSHIHFCKFIHILIFVNWGHFKMSVQVNCCPLNGDFFFHTVFPCIICFSVYAESTFVPGGMLHLRLQQNNFFQAEAVTSCLLTSTLGSSPREVILEVWLWLCWWLLLGQRGKLGLLVLWKKLLQSPPGCRCE